MLYARAQKIIVCAILLLNFAFPSSARAEVTTDTTTALEDENFPVSVDDYFSIVDQSQDLNDLVYPFITTNPIQLNPTDLSPQTSLISAPITNTDSDSIESAYKVDTLLAFVTNASIGVPINKLSYSKQLYQQNYLILSTILRDGRFFYDVMIDANTQNAPRSQFDKLRNIQNKHLWTATNLQKLYSKYWPDLLDRSDKSRFISFTSVERARLAKHYEAMNQLFGLFAQTFINVHNNTSCTSTDRDKYVNQKSCWNNGDLDNLYKYIIPSLKNFRSYNSFLPEKELLGLIYDQIGKISIGTYDANQFFQGVLENALFFLVPVDLLITIPGKYLGGKVLTFVGTKFFVGKGENALIVYSDQALERAGLKKLAASIHEVRYITKSWTVPDESGGLVTFDVVSKRNLRKWAGVTIRLKAKVLMEKSASKLGLDVLVHNSPILGKYSVSLTEAFAKSSIPVFKRKAMIETIANSGDALLSTPVINAVASSEQKQFILSQIKDAKLYSQDEYFKKFPPIILTIEIARVDGVGALSINETALSEVYARVGKQKLNFDPTMVHEFIHGLVKKSANPDTVFQKVPWQYGGYAFTHLIESNTEYLTAVTLKHEANVPLYKYIQQMDGKEDMKVFLNIVGIIGKKEGKQNVDRILANLAIRDGYKDAAGNVAFDKWLGKGVSEQVNSYMSADKYDKAIELVRAAK